MYYEQKIIGQSEKICLREWQMRNTPDNYN